MAGYRVSDRVVRPLDVFDPFSPLRRGVVVERYGRRSMFGWYDPELYAVRWDDGSIERGFFRHGLSRATLSGGEA
jgi:hypothetical protein